jgi:hypothetical protein
MSEKEIVKKTNELSVGLEECEYRFLRRKSILNQNIITEDKKGNVVAVPARTVFQKIYKEEVCTVPVM